MATVLEVTFKGAILGQTVENVIHFQKATWALTDYAPMAAYMAANWIGNVKTFIPLECTWNEINIRNVTIPTEAPFTSSIAVVCTSSSIAGMPPFVCFLIRLQTATAGRTGRGRFYISSPNPGHVVNGLITASTTSFVNGVCVSLMNHFGPAHVSDYQIGIIQRGNAASYKPVTAMQCDTVPRVQRRRNMGVGI